MQIMTTEAAQPWFKTWFDSRYYHQLYRHRDETEARNFIDALLNELSPRRDSCMLDAGCGKGRHSRYLASKGFRVYGFDLAFSSIREAKKFENENLRFYQHDMRLPFGHEKFDQIFNFFTSFGYFKNENDQVIRNMSNALKSGGTLLIDYLNLVYAEKHIVPVEEKEIDGVLYHINRWSDEAFMYKRIEIRDHNSHHQVEYTEQVARFGLDDFKKMFSKNGLQLTAVYGDYELNPYAPASSRRLIMCAEKQAEAKVKKTFSSQPQP